MPTDIEREIGHGNTGLIPWSAFSDVVETVPELAWPNFRRNVFDPAVRSLGLDPLTPHDLRHTTASLAVSAGANVKSIQRLLGHASAAMTLDTYAGLFSSDLDQVAVRLDAAARDSSGTGAAEVIMLDRAASS